MVLGTYGKRANLDRQLQRPFFAQRSPYLGVKYHLRLPGFPRDVIALHNFADGYAGISAIEEDKLCFCYLTTRQNLKQHGTIPAMEREVLARNPRLREILDAAEVLYPQPEVINEISFAPKQPVEQHVLMVGDAAGLITPLCGNGMAMALHGAALAAAAAARFSGRAAPRRAAAGSSLCPRLAGAVWGAAAGGPGGAAAVWRAGAERAGGGRPAPLAGGGAGADAPHPRPGVLEIAAAGWQRRSPNIRPVSEAGMLLVLFSGPTVQNPCLIP